MELVLKSYKCTFPKFFIDAYNQYMWQDPKQFEVIYGKNHKDAVNKRCMGDDIHSFWELKQNINTRRFPENDLYCVKKSNLLNVLNDKEINHLTHSLGVRIGELCPDDFYRNYSFYNDKNSDCERLVKLGLMSNRQKGGGEIYSVTDIGIEAVKTLLLVRKI